MTDKLERFFEGRLPNEWQAKAMLISPISKAARVVMTGPEKGDVVWGRAMRPEEYALITEDTPTASEHAEAVKEMLIDLVSRTWAFYANSRMSTLRLKNEELRNENRSWRAMANEVRTAGGWVADIVDIYKKELGD